MSIQTMAMSDLGDTLITLGFDVSEMLSKMWFCLRTVSMSEEVSFSEEFVWGKKGILIIFK